MASFYKHHKPIKTNQSKLLEKLNALVNRYGGDVEFVANMDKWPKTIKKFVFGSPKLMARFGLAEYHEELEE